mgnify:CR=1 FL=1
MKTDVIKISSRGLGMQTALEQVEKVTAYKGLTGKDALHLRLLAEEMMGMMRSITGETTGEFWIEDDEKGTYQLHLAVITLMDMNKRDQLLAASTSGKNEAARGLMGRLRNFFEQGVDSPSAFLYARETGEYSATPTLDIEWTLSMYQRQLESWMPTDEKAKEMWDELEKSVVTHVADDIRVAIRGDHAEMVIIKKFG